MLPVLTPLSVRLSQYYTGKALLASLVKGAAADTRREEYLALFTTGVNVAAA